MAILNINQSDTIGYHIDLGCFMAHNSIFCLVSFRMPPIRFIIRWICCITLSEKAEIAYLSSIFCLAASPFCFDKLWLECMSLNKNLKWSSSGSAQWCPFQPLYKYESVLKKWHLIKPNHENIPCFNKLTHTKWVPHNII